MAASALGALWGFGHSTGQMILGLVFILLKVRLSCQNQHGHNVPVWNDRLKTQCVHFSSNVLAVDMFAFT
jgi:hypothetical protein